MRPSPFATSHDVISKQWRRAGTAGRVFVVKCGCGASGAACLEVEASYEAPEPPPSRARENVEGLAWGAFFNDALHSGCSACRPQARKWMRAS